LIGSLDKVSLARWPTTVSGPDQLKLPSSLMRHIGRPLEGNCGTFTNQPEGAHHEELQWQHLRVLSLMQTNMEALRLAKSLESGGPESGKRLDALCCEYDW
jgi:hypothetical protein